MKTVLETLDQMATRVNYCSPQISLMSSKLPLTKTQWLTDVREAHCGAVEHFAFMSLTAPDEQDATALWRIAPAICMKRRKVEESESNIDKALEAVTSTLDGFKENNGVEIQEYPANAFALAYLATHFGIGFKVDEDVFNEVMEAVADDFEKNNDAWYPKQQK